MLKRTPSLALRASIIFASVFAAIIIAIALTSAFASWADRGTGNLRGPVIAVDYAAEELREVGGTLQLPASGRFADLAARNPSIWLIAVRDRRVFTMGKVGRPALETVSRLQTAIDSVVLRLPGQHMPLAAGALQRRDLGFGTVVLAAGGVDPATLSTRESIHLLLEPGLLLGLLAVAAISLLAMFVAVPSFTRALVPITREAEAIVPEDPGRRLQEDKAPSELLPLVRGFNTALARLELELGRRKRFVADVAHELRTPLAVVSLQADNLSDGDGKAELQGGLRRLTKLVSQMLDLERLSLSRKEHALVDLADATRSVVADLAPLAISRGYDLSLTEPGKEVIVRGDVHAISRAITNLVSNAIAYGGGTGAITVTVGANRTIEIIDEGPGVAPDLEARLFEPFSRGNDHVEGCGLGLHLTREIMRMHGGEIRLLSSPRGARFEMMFAKFPGGGGPPAE